MSEEKKEIAIRGKGLELSCFQDMQRFAACIVDSFKTGVPCVPKTYNSLPQVVMAIQAGGELGLPPMQSLNSLYPIDGKFSLFTEAANALATQSGEIISRKVYWRWTDKGKMQESDESPVDMTLEDMEKTNLTCVIELKTKIENRKYVYSVQDAKTAGLWKAMHDGKKRAVWWNYPKDMLQNRCLSRALHGSLPNVLRGVKIEGDIESVQETTAEPAPAIAPKEEPQEIEYFDGTPVIIGAPAEKQPEIKPAEVVEIQPAETEPLPQGVDAEFVDGLFEENNELETTANCLMELCEKIAKQIGGGAMDANKALERLLKRAGIKDISTIDRAARMLKYAEDFAKEKGVK